MTLTNVLETIHALNLSASVGNGQCIVVFHGDGSPPSFVRAKRDGSFDRRDVLNALRAN